MELVDSAQLAISNLTSPPVLAFLAGVLAVTLLRADLRLPAPVYQALSMYLLLAIGLKGGVSLAQADLADVVAPAVAALALGVAIPVAAFYALGWVTRLGVVDRGAMAAHYGSTSLVTFTAAIALLDMIAMPFEGYVATLLTIMEVPGIIVGLMLASRARSVRTVPASLVLVSAGGGARGGTSGSGSMTDDDITDSAPAVTNWRESLREVLTGPSVLLLVGGLAIGWITGPQGYEKAEPLFSGMFQGILTIFLLHLGCVAGSRLRTLPSAGPGLIVFALVFPLLSGSAGVLAGAAVGLSAGGAAVLGVLCASASYIAAPAAIGLALPRANDGLCLTASLGLTFPFNLVIGIPVLVALATEVTRL